MKVLLTCAWVGTLSEETGCTKQHRGGRILGVLPFSSLQIKDVFRGLTYTGNFKEVNCTFTRENTKELAQLSKRFLFPLHYFLRPLYQSQQHGLPDSTAQEQNTGCVQIKPETDLALI